MHVSSIRAITICTKSSDHPTKVLQVISHLLCCSYRFTFYVAFVCVYIYIYIFEVVELARSPSTRAVYAAKHVIRLRTWLSNKSGLRHRHSATRDGGLVISWLGFEIRRFGGF